MHLRRKGVKRSDERFHVGGEEIKVMVITVLILSLSLQHVCVCVMTVSDTVK